MAPETKRPHPLKGFLKFVKFVIGFSAIVALIVFVWWVMLQEQEGTRLFETKTVVYSAHDILRPGEWTPDSTELARCEERIKPAMGEFITGWDEQTGRVRMSPDWATWSDAVKRSWVKDIHYAMSAKRGARDTQFLDEFGDEVARADQKGIRIPR